MLPRQAQGEQAMDGVRIFISYRRDDSAGYARAIGDELARRWGASSVFMDVDDIGAGQRFAEVIEQAVGASELLLVLIGARWAGPRPGQPPRLFDDDDFVRREVATGLARGMHVIPVLLDGAPMPAATELPPLLQPLTALNAVELRGTRYAADLERLLAALHDALGPPVPAAAVTLARPARGRRRLAVVAGTAGIAGLIGLGWMLRPQTPPQPPKPSRPQVNGRWEADVEYDWHGARYIEHFEFEGEGDDLYGTASFLRVPRGVLEGRVDPEGLSFVTRTTQTSGGAERESVHRYRGRLVDGEFRFVLQTEGGFTRHVPVSFVARRAPAAASAATR